MVLVCKATALSGRHEGIKCTLKFVQCCIHSLYASFSNKVVVTVVTYD